MSSLLERSYVRSHPADSILTDVRDSSEVFVIEHEDLARFPQWKQAFAHLRKDSRYYEIVEDTICPEFEYRYMAITDRRGQICAIQPFFVLDQDLLAGIGPRLRAVVSAIRRYWPHFLTMRTLMVGCAAGEGHLAAAESGSRFRDATLMSKHIVEIAREEKAGLIVLKEFPAAYREALSCFCRQGFTRVPSMPMTSLNIGYKSFDDYMTRALKSATRKNLRKKFHTTERADPIELTVVSDASPFLDELYPLYLDVFERSKLKFEKLTKPYFGELGRRMPDKVRFFLWRQNGKLIAFALCMVEGDTLYGEYLGLDYKVALDLHLYHYVMRDVIAWGIANGFTSFSSTSLNYTPKLQMRHLLKPLDLYVRHTSPLLNAVLKRVLPLLEPTRSDPVLRHFPNYEELWGEPVAAR